MTADLAPFLLAAPSGEIELFLATQLVDEARHAAFFDRFGAEVMCLSVRGPARADREVEQVLTSPWHECSTTACATWRTGSRPAGRPRPVRRGHHDLPHGRRGLPRRDGPDA